MVKLSKTEMSNGHIRRGENLGKRSTTRYDDVSGFKGRLEKLKGEWKK